MKIMLDPGHYGKYNNSPANRAYWESEAMWKMCGYLKTALEGYGITVGVTRTDASKDRAVTDRGKAAKGYDLFISLHSNAVGDGKANESTDYPLVIVPLNKKGDAIGNKLAAIVEKTMKTKQKGRITTKATSSGADYYGVIRGAVSVGVVGIIIEHSFHTQTAATNWLLKESNLKTMANAEAAVIAAHYGLSKGQATANPAAPTPATVEGDKTIWDFLTGKGLNAYAVAGIMGNLFAESGLKSNNLQNSYEKSLKHTDASYTAAVDNGTYTNFVKDKAGYGLAQWTYYTRKQALLDFVKAAGASIGDLSTQLNFLWKELQGYKAVMTVLKSAKSVAEASNVILTQYERPADQSAAVQVKRAGYGQGYYEKYAGKAAAPDPAPSTPAVFTPYKVKVTVSALNYRKGAGTNHAVAGTIRDKGVYTIVEESSGTGAKLWGRLKSGAGWIALDHTKKV